MAETSTPATPAAEATPATGIVITRIGDKIIEPPTETPPVETPPVETPPVAAAEGTPPAEPAGEPVPAPAGPTGPTAADDSDGEEVEFFPYAAERTKGAVKSAEDVFALYEDNTKLKKQLAERPKIEFPNEQAKLLYEMASKFPGQELSAGKSILHVLSLDVSKLSEKEKQFEAFALEHREFPREEARKYFEAKYEKNFAPEILETDVMAQFEHKVQTKKAEETIAKVLDEFSKLPPSKPAGEPTQQSISPEDLAEIKQEVSEVLSRFGGVRYEFFPNDPTSIVNVPLEDADLQKLESYMVDPGEFLKDLQQECLDDNGNFDNGVLAMAMFEFKNRERIREQAFKAGVTYGELKKIKEIKNTSTPRAPEPPTPGKAAPKTLAEAMVAAGVGVRKKATA